jgi:tetratricopeptide (TPR) repeat protein
MIMDTAHIIYAALFRLAIIASGFGCVVMGYRLFVMGVMPKEGSEIDANAGQIRLSLKNAAPGTCFAALGIIMIVVMLVQGNPEKKISETPTKEGIKREVSWRAGDHDIENAMIQGQNLEKADRLPEAIQAYAKPLTNARLSLGEATAIFRAIAGAYLKENRIEEAIAFASLANHIDPECAQGLALCARIELARRDHQKAFDYISRAAQIDNAFIEERDRIKEQMP